VHACVLCVDVGVCMLCVVCRCGCVHACVLCVGVGVCTHVCCV
jgi:hypothetical protein